MHYFMDFGSVRTIKVVRKVMMELVKLIETCLTSILIRQNISDSFCIFLFVFFFFFVHISWWKDYCLSNLKEISSFTFDLYLLFSKYLRTLCYEDWIFCNNEGRGLPLSLILSLSSWIIYINYNNSTRMESKKKILLVMV